jgi:serine/threonine protein kinase
MQPQAPAPLRLSSFTGFTRDRTGGGDSDSAGFTQDRTSGGMDSVGVESVGGFSFQSDVSISGNPPVLATSQVQPYTVIKEIGGGGAGKAYIVTGKADGKRYVAKQIICLSDQYSAAQASYALQETRLLFLLQHPHICKLVDFYPKSANFFIIMEYCEQVSSLVCVIHRAELTAWSPLHTSLGVVDHS